MDYIWAFMTILLFRVDGRRMRKTRPERLDDEEIDNSLPEFPSPLPSHRFFYTRDEPPKDLMDKDYTFDSTLVDITADRELEEKLIARLDSEGPYPDWQDIEDEIQKLQKARNMEFRDEAAGVLERTHGVSTSTDSSNSSTGILADGSMSTSTEKPTSSSGLRILQILSTTTADPVIPLTSTTSPFVPFDWTSDPGEVDLDAAVEIAEADGEPAQTIEPIVELSEASKNITSTAKSPVIFSSKETSALSSTDSSASMDTTAVNSTPVRSITAQQGNETTSSTELPTTLMSNEASDEEIDRLVASLATALTPKPKEIIDDSTLKTVEKSSLKLASSFFMTVFALTILRHL
ncbi:unnamed protein product [Bursaphelenchus xylophilus]|uniref:(pine wood nematode) hypothetical protein n=1 Tax=Bursaphelenchus xylophilus TaxID=6326 RepID=A0A1I7RIZ7_BURXY|nr:unnamed protein product [Bursaphelenchus xylophilus]CAG9119195.1 unnamed protein product [Bursaphelenchus xylophilus]